MINIYYHGASNNFSAFISASVNIITDVYNNRFSITNMPNIRVNYWDGNDVRISIRDNDDFDIGVIYEGNTKEEARQIFHELVNFLNDIDGKIVNDDTFFDGNKNTIASFFPDLGCPRHWELEL